MNKINIGKDLYLKGRIGWQGLSKDEYLEISEYKIINATSLMDGYVDWSNCGYITKERYEEAKEIQLQENDILISKDGTLGKIGYVKNITTSCSVASGIFVLRNVKPSLINFDYLYHVLKSPIFKDFIKRNKALGSTIPHLYQRDLENFEIGIPDLAKQTKIAKVLNLLDSKIENNNKIHVELESMAKTLYDYWFLQFEFPNEEGKPYKSSGGKMVYNKELKREIPEGWKATELLELVDWITNSQPPKSEFKYTSEIGYVRFIQNRDYDSDSHFTYVQNRKSMNKVGRLDILIDKYGDAGLVRYGIEGVFNVALAQIKPKKVKMREYIRSLLLSNSMYTYFHNSCMASTRASLSEENLKLVFVAEPPIKLVEKFEEILSTMRKTILKNDDENEELKSLRDFLLPLLMNGQVTFKENKLWIG